MKKEEILEKSRKENKNQDEYEKEVIKEGGNIGAAVAAILATIFFVIQILLGEGMNYGLYAIVFSIPAAGYIVKAVRLHRKREVVAAILCTIAVITFSAAHVYQLFTATSIL